MNQKQRQFTLEAFRTNEPAEAYLTVYKAKSKAVASACATRLLKNVNVRSYLAELRQKIEDKAVVEVRERRTILSQIARATILDFKDGRRTVVNEQSANVSAVMEHDTSEIVLGRGEEAVAVEIVKLKLRDPMTAIDLLNKMDKLYGDAHGEGINVNTWSIHIGEGTDEARRTLISLLDRYVTRIGEAEVVKEPDTRPEGGSAV